MITDSLLHCDRYAGVHARFAAGFAYLKAFSHDTPTGVYELDERRLFASVERFHSVPADTRKWEAHRPYADIQFVVSGRERMLYTPLGNLRSILPYDGTKDVEKFEVVNPGRALAVDVYPGSFCVFFPQDGHKPMCQVAEPEPVLKVVLKVRLE